MLDYWKRLGEVRSTAQDLKIFALDIFVSAGYRDSLALILAMDPNLVPRITFPAKLARVGQAIVSFKEFMVQDLEGEKKTIAGRRVTRENLMTNLMRASVESAAGGDGPEETDGKPRASLSHEEIFGNMFVFNFAGHDSTVHSLTYAFYLLAAHSEVQDWINEEIRLVFKNSNVSTWSYESFSQFQRCLAVLDFSHR
ncbi:uncharacterized protein K452DRAFT_130448 [Neofusicoccum parvum]|nr:uncharacterized protein K452DRAFT_130448 [Neofusicoccum parvum]